MFGGQATACWRASTRPSLDTFRQAIGATSHLKAFTGVAVAALLGTALSWLTHRLLHEPTEEFMGLASVWVKDGTPAPLGSWIILVPLGVVYGFYSFEIVLYIFARLLGGKGSFGAQSYVQSLFYAPLAVVQQVVVAVPDVGRLLFMLVAAGSLIPTTTSLEAAHRYSTGRAVLTWVLPVVLNVVVVTVIVILISRGRS